MGNSKGVKKVGLIGRWKSWAKRLKRDILSLYFAYKDKRVPLLTKILILLVISYAFSPIDLIPDFIPILGYLDDLILLPIGIYIVIKLIPEDVLVDARERASNTSIRPQNWIAGIFIIMIWIVLLGWILLLFLR